MQPKPKHAQWNPAISEPFRSWEPWWELSIHENPLPTKQLTIADPWPLLVHQDLSLWPRDSPSARPAMTFLVHCFDLDSEAARLTFFPGSSLNRGRIWSSSLLQASYQVCALTLHRHGKAWSPLPGHRQQGHTDSEITLGYAKWHMGALHTTTISPWKAVAETWRMSGWNSTMFGKWKRCKKNRPISEKLT